MRALKVLLFGDVGVPTGFGRIGAAVGKYLAAHGCQVVGACLQYDGLLPPPTGVPFFVAALAGKDHAQALTGIAAAFQPDVIVSLQDFPYHILLREATGIDWSVTGHVAITPVDGVPIAPEWLASVDQYDGFMTISEFGVRAFRDAGKRAILCPPGVDTDEFYPLAEDVRAALRERIGLPRGAFVVGMMAMNQGRKDFPRAVEGFCRAFRDVPDAYLYLDCEKHSPAGWRLPEWVFQTVGLDPARVRFREDALRAGIFSLNERYNLLDQHMVIAHREGFGLPHLEAMAAGVPTAAVDYCSGREIVGEHGARGLLIRADRGSLSTWGGAWDYDADPGDLAAQLRWAYEHPAERQAMAARALDYARSRTWEAAGRAVEAAVRAAVRLPSPLGAPSDPASPPGPHPHEVGGVSMPVFLPSLLVGEGAGRGGNKQSPTGPLVGRVTETGDGSEAGEQERDPLMQLALPGFEAAGNGHRGARR